jgi:hypothetical protein
MIPCKGKELEKSAQLTQRLNSKRQETHMLTKYLANEFELQHY